ncbi:MAG: isopeptide-forming domain-containing fimbrial protein [Candidatus Saccharibacteria bacterium]|nr:isopeptide-forming domain-containing fimbrial protein [Candidatus Saccharibacteria bacterium]
MKKGTLFAIAASFAVISQIATAGLASAQASSYVKYNDIPSLIDADYAASKIYYTDDTKITAKKVSNDGKEAGAVKKTDRFYVDAGDNLVFLIENSTATDYYGNPVDVIWKIDNVRFADSAKIRATNEVVSQRDLSIYFSASSCGSAVEAPKQQECTDSTYILNAGDPILFWIDTHFTKADFTVQYIKKGSFNDATLSGTPAGIDKLTYMTFDLDVPNYGYVVEYNDGVLGEGNEGSFVKSSDSSKTTYYYNKGFESDYFHVLYEVDNGVAIKPINNGGQDASFNGIHFANSFFAMAENMKDSSYKFTYSATGAGIGVFFGSLAAYDTKAPEKFITDNDFDFFKENTAQADGDFNYVIRQSVPNQYSSEHDIIGFASLWTRFENVKNDRNYTSFVINDEISEDLEIVAADKIKVTRKGVDVTDEFDIAVEGKKVSVAAKADSLKQAAFYGTEILVNIPVKVKSNVKVGQEINNTASLTFANTGNQPSTKDSDEVVTTIIEKIVENPKTDDRDLLVFFVMFGASTAGSAVLLAKTTKRR